jgi:glycosyltransferase involved in cell wall biosynthesis
VNIAISMLNINMTGSGGVQNRLRHLVEGLLDNGIKLHIIQTKKSHRMSQGYYDSLDHSSNLKFINVKDVGNIKIPWDYLRLHVSSVLKNLKEKNIGVIDTYDPYLYTNKVTLPVVYTTNFFIDYVQDLFRIGEIRYSYLHLLKCMIEGRLIDRADHFIIQNSIQKTRLVEYYGIDEDKISIIPTGFNSTLINRIKSSSKPEVDKQIILYSGRLSEYKGLFELFEAFDEISKIKPTWDLWLVGDGPDRRYLEAYARAHGFLNRVKFFGRQDLLTTLKYTNMCDVFAFPSYIESIPSSLLEAMALGKPVVVTDVGAIGTDIVDGDCGVLVPPKDPKALKDGLLKLMGNEKLRRELGSKAEKKVKGITREKMIKNTVKVYERVMNR